MFDLPSVNLDDEARRESQAGWGEQRKRVEKEMEGRERERRDEWGIEESERGQATRKGRE